MLGIGAVLLTGHILKLPVFLIIGLLLCVVVVVKLIDRSF